MLNKLILNVHYFNSTKESFKKTLKNSFPPSLDVMDNTQKKFTDKINASVAQRTNNLMPCVFEGLLAPETNILHFSPIGLWFPQMINMISI